MQNLESLAGKNTPQRNELAERLRLVRRADRGIDRGVGYDDYRDLYQYLVKLDGLRHFLDYVGKVDDRHILLDLGSGETVAANELQHSSFGSGLDIRGVSLTRKPEVEHNLGFEKTYITPVERLRRIDDQSVSGIISVHGISYSSLPAATVAAIDRVLVPGGAVKSLFKSPFTEKSHSHPLQASLRTHHEFTKAFSDLGYDFAYDFTQAVVLVIKPGGDSTASAEQLLKADDRLDVKGWREERDVLKVIAS